MEEGFHSTPPSKLIMLASVRFLEFQYRLSPKRRLLQKPYGSVLPGYRVKSIPVPLLPVFQFGVGEMKKVFDMLDTDRDGKISREEYKVVLKAIEQDDIGSDKWVSKLFKVADLDRDGYIDFKEFVEVQTIEGGVRTRDIQEAFRAFDLDQDGLISADDLMRMLGKLGERCSIKDCRKMVRAADVDGDGVIDMGDFTNMMTRTMRSVSC